jgi:hypothetical protein|tara:strand:- start:128 stop:883 length:756 start_codon:yes stop_codon:yes gene_type:complete
MATGIVNPYAVAAGGLSYEDECLADSPVGLWMMNETSGTTIVNQGSSGTAGNGSYGTTFSPVLAGDTLFGLTTPDFQNSQDFVLMTYPVGSTPDAGVTGAATWEYLFRIDGSLGAYHFGILPAPYNALMAFSQASGTYSAQILTTYGASPMYVYAPAGTLVSGTEYHCVITYDRAAPRLEVWINGVSVAAVTTLNSNTSTGTAALTQPVGGYSKTSGTTGIGSTLGGSLGGYAMYAGVLSNARIADHYAAL